MRALKYTFISAFVLLSILYIFTQQILTFYASLFIIDNATKGADAIIVLGGDSHTRPSYAAKLFNDGYAKKILLTSPKQYTTELMGILKSEKEEYIDVLKAFDLNASFIPSTKNGATSTFDEAIDLVEYLKTHKMNHIIILTDSFHTARANYAFTKILESSGFTNLKVEMAAAPNRIYDKTNWYTTEKGIKSYILEPILYIFYIFNSSNATIVKEG